MSVQAVVDATFCPSTFGGGWMLAKSRPALRALVQFYGDDPAPLAPLDGAVGFIVEPSDVESLAGYLCRRNLVTEIG